MALLVDGRAVTPPTIEVAQVLAVADEEVLFAAAPSRRRSRSGAGTRATGSRRSPRARESTPPSGSGGVRVFGSSAMDRDGARWACATTCSSHSRAAGADATVLCSTVGERRLQVGLVLPRDHEPGRRAAGADGPLWRPALPAGDGGRHGWLEPQWLADQGFAVHRRRRAGNPRPRGGVGARGARRSRRAGARGSDRRAGRGRGARSRPRSGARRESGAGRSAAFSPRWPCCGVRTSSTPRWRARRSPSGGSTTPTTPSATSGSNPTARIGRRTTLVAPGRRGARCGVPCC